MDQETYEQYEAQEALQQKQLEGQQSVYAPQIYEQVQQAQAILVESTNPKKVVEEIMLVLRGLEKKPDGTLVRVGVAKMNEYGIRTMWTWVRGLINQSIILSHYEENEINALMNSIQDDFVDDLALNWKDYGIRNKTDLDLINNLVLINIQAALKRALGQNEKNWLGKISIENISAMPRMPKPKKEGWLSKFKL